MTEPRKIHGTHSRANRICPRNTVVTSVDWQDKVFEYESFLEWTRTSFKYSLAEFYTILLEEHLQVVLEMLEVRISSSI
jgi:hypothetical protein